MEDESKDWEIKIVNKRSASAVRDGVDIHHNIPSATEVAVIMAGDGSAPNTDRDIIVQYKANSNDTTVPAFKRISALHPSYRPLAYPLIFPYGNDGFHLNIPLTSNIGSRSKVTMMEIMPSDFNTEQKMEANSLSDQNAFLSNYVSIGTQTRNCPDYSLS